MTETPAPGSRWFAVPAFLLAAAAVFAAWWTTGRPVAVPDGAGGKIPCVSYTPFRGVETPFDETLVAAPERIEEDFRLLKGRVGCVRTYAVDQGLDRVPEIAARHGIKVLLGVWIGREHEKNIQQLEAAARLANEHPNAVRAIVVGNEVLLRRERTARDLAGYIGFIRQRTNARLTYADVWEFWLKNPELAGAVDFVTIHILPYWEDEPTANAKAPAYTVETWRQARQSFDGKLVFVGETGWPSAGRMREGARPGAIEQARFFRELSRLAAKEDGLDFNLIEAFDQPWKRASEGTVGGHWGLFDDARRAKFPWTGPVTPNPGWLFHFAAGAAVALILFGGALGARLPAGRWLVLAFFAHVAGALIVLAAAETADAGRNVVEWILGGGGMALSFLAAWFLLRTLAGARQAPRPAPVGRALDWLARPRPADLDRAMALGLICLFVLAGATAQTLALVFDGRYRGFPVAAYLVPAAALAALAWLERAPRPADPHAFALAAVLAAGAIAVAIIEGPANTQALAWTGTALLLALPWLKPIRP
ncbi:MAG: glycoside hydrolase family 17 [Alphaproteobacteria bacterium]|nr:glycoside hydrolase family 17 [Alphaproteobacteria bacterium]